MKNIKQSRCVSLGSVQINRHVVNTLCVEYTQPAYDFKFICINLYLYKPM